MLFLQPWNPQHCWNFKCTLLIRTFIGWRFAL